MPHDTTSSPSMKRTGTEIHVPWLGYAMALDRKYRNELNHQDQSSPLPTLSLAIELAKEGFDRSRTVRRVASSVEEDDSEKKREYEREEFDAEVASLRQRFEATLKVGAAHALEQILTKLRKELPAEPTVADVQRALSLPTKAPPALVSYDDPSAEILDSGWIWVKQVLKNFNNWAVRLGNAFVPEPWLGNAWNHAWSSSSALTVLDWLLDQIPAASKGEKSPSWESVTTILLDPSVPLNNMRGRIRKIPSCLPTGNKIAFNRDGKQTGLRVRLQLNQWLAKALDPTAGHTTEQHDLIALNLLLSGLGDRSNSDKFLSNGLLVGHLYLSIFIQRVNQCTNTVTSSEMKMHHFTPPKNLPVELKHLRPGHWEAAFIGIAETQEEALAAHLKQPRGVVWKTRRAPPPTPLAARPLRLLPGESLQWQPPPDPGSDSLGSIELSSFALDMSNPPQYTDCSVLVKLGHRWYVVYPELWDVEDEDGDEDSERVALHAYAQLPTALREAGGWPRLAEAMPHAKWVGHFRGLGVLLLAALDLDRWFLGRQ